MSIINEALKKLQNQISHTHPHAKPSSEQTAVQQQPTELTAAQQAGFQPVPETSVQVSQPAAEPSVQKPKGSRLVIILGILCLLTALFAPVVNKQSVMGMLLAKLPKNISISLPKTQKIKPQTPAEALAAAEPEKKVEPIQKIIQNLTGPAAAITKSGGTPSSRIIVNGVMTHGAENLVLIDGQVYEEGNEVDGVKILKITSKGITVLENGSERFIKVMGQ